MAKKKIEKIDTSERRKKLENVVEDINRKIPGAISFAEDTDGSFILRRPTGILSLDNALRGGFPKGIIEIIGEPNIGKTALVCKTAVEVQNNYKENSCIGIIAIEKFDKKFWKDLGLKIAFSDEEIKYMEEGLGRKLTETEYSQYKEQVGEIVISPALTVEDALEVCLGMVKSKLFQLIIVDSIGAVVTDAQNEKTLDEKTYGGIAGPMGTFVNKVNLLNENTTILIVNQLRDNLKMKNPYDDPYKEAGGWALKHAKLVSLRMTRGEQIKKKVQTNDLIIGRYVNWVIKKGKGGTPEGSKGSYPFYKGKYGYTLGIDAVQDIILTGVEYDVIEKAGAWFSFDGEKLGQGLEEATENLRKTPKKVEEIVSKVWELDKEKNNYVFITKEV
jgi:recombination protein RecA